MTKGSHLTQLYVSLLRMP